MVKSGCQPAVLRLFSRCFAVLPRLRAQSRWLSPLSPAAETFLLSQTPNGAEKCVILGLVSAHRWRRRKLDPKNLASHALQELGVEHQLQFARPTRLCLLVLVLQEVVIEDQRKLARPVGVRSGRGLGGCERADRALPEAHMPNNLLDHIPWQRSMKLIIFICLSAGTPVSLGDLLKHRDVQSLFGHDLLEPIILFLE